MVVVDGGAVVAGVPGSVAGGACVVGTVIVPGNDEPSTSCTESFAVGSGTSLASGK